jgi:hypothetical protein
LEHLIDNNDNDDDNDDDDNKDYALQIESEGGPSADPESVDGRYLPARKILKEIMAKTLT